jgi:pimeloyl-ACP methyl ester carboxylesterase
MPKVRANNIAMNYDQQGTGEPLILIPYLAADHACYTFQVAEYAKHFTCISLDLRGTGESDDPEGDYTTEGLADDVAAFMQALGIARAHVAGLSLGANIGMWLAGKHPDKVQSLSVHAGCQSSDPFIKTIIDGWQVMAGALNSVPEMVIRGIFPWCFTPELYAARPDYIQALTDFVRSRPAQTLSSFMRQSAAVLAHDVSAQLGRISAPTQITVGSLDQITSTRFARPMKEQIRGAELVIFERCAHAHIYEQVEEFNQKSLQFLLRHAGSASGSLAQPV